MVTQHSVKCGKQTDQNYVQIYGLWVWKMFNVGIHITYGFKFHTIGASLI